MSRIDGTQKAVSLVATISYLFLGIGYFFVPLVIYAYYSGKDEYIAYNAKKAWMTHLVFASCSFFVFLLSMVVVGFVFVPFLCILGLIWFVNSLYSCYLILQGERAFYLFSTEDFHLLGGG